MSQLPPAPIQSPLNQRLSLDFNQDSGRLTLPWIVWLNNLAETVNSFVGGGAASYVDEVTLTADAPIASPATPNEGDQLTLYINEDATGGWQITWDALFLLVTPDDLDVRANYTSIFQFIGTSTNEWKLNAVPFSRPS